MSDFTIITNNHPRELVAFCGLPESAKSDFDYVREEEDQHGARFVRYKRAWYDVNEFVRIVKPGALNTGFAHIDFSGKLEGWEGIQGDTYFSATLVRYVDDGERVIVGRCFS